ncbi:MAG: hypothetical protein EDR02_10585 [Actinobacteria bacterium]|nr:MAG: hypothetical protein EDR02_10585 [Actinomycetota bacterium]RIK04944.1 MAG: hypothetical protein DCC48_11355 [Acidobacteriota bacterium]
MSQTLVIPRRFCGPPDSGNGGWTCGSLAQHLEGQVEVTLRRPPPLGRPLEITHLAEGLVLSDEGALVAEATLANLDLEQPQPVPASIAAEATKGYKGFEHHIFPTCFTCGPERAEHDGLRIFAGPVTGRPHTVADCWTPDASLSDTDGMVPEPIVWAALDCPSGWVHLGDGVVALLGRMTARLHSKVEAGVPYVVVAESAGAEGRKRYSRSALFTGEGEAVAVARATWIVVER